MRRHLRHEIQLVAEFGIFVPVGHIAACRHIEIMHPWPAIDDSRDMAAVGPSGPVHMSAVRQWQPRDNRNAVIAFLAAIDLMRPSGIAQRLGRKMLVLGLRFLKAEHINVMIAQKTGDQVDPQTHRVDVPGCQSHDVNPECW